MSTLANTGPMDTGSMDTGPAHPETRPSRTTRRRGRHLETAAGVRVGRAGLGTAGVLAILVSAWGGIVPYVGPLFGYSGDGTGAWHWSLAHGVLALAPGIAGVLLGFLVLAESRGITVGRGRIGLATAGSLLMVCGAWFAIGPLAWPVLSNGSAYFVSGSHLRILADMVGYSIGTGIVLVVCGAFVDGWASRHQRKATVVARPGADADADTVRPGNVETGLWGDGR